jgi:hypothetical protein
MTDDDAADNGEDNNATDDNTDNNANDDADNNNAMQMTDYNAGAMQCRQRMTAQMTTLPPR